MAKQKKKRNKVYTGKGATLTRPVITRISATNRSRFSQWWFENKSKFRPILVTGSVTLFVILIIIQIFKLITGA